MYINAYFSAANLFRMEIDNDECKFIISEMFEVSKSKNIPQSKKYHLNVYDVETYQIIYTVSDSNIAPLMRVVYYVLFSDKKPLEVK
jgi:hypothetical protein